MASSSTAKALSSTSNPHTYNYDVFLSFRGKDTRNTFTDHLYANLVAHGIHTFRDDEELEKGGNIAPYLQRGIEESKIFIVIFSRNYADSKWCLNELVKIIDCMTKKGSLVWPVFYHVDPRDVRNQRGSFGDAFSGHAKDADEEKEKTIEIWKEALMTAGKISGDHLENQSEAGLIQKIREAVIAKLNRKPLYAGDNIIGMDFHLEQLKPLIQTELDEVHMVGIFGPGGIGKTTISIAIYNHISSQFDGISFLKNVGGKCEDGLLKLQKTLLQDILKCKKPKFDNINEGINVIKERLQSKRVLIVLDDVDEYTQLENLAGKHGWYGAKSIIVITTRNQHLLDQHEVKVRYEVEKLNDEQSTKVFNWWAFKQSTPIAEFESLSNSVVKYADGLPIALKVLGGLFFKRSIDEWKSQLDKLREIPDRTIQNVLKVSYDKLDSMEQEIFLDIACFFRGEDKDFVSRILGSNAMIGIRVLHDRSLITISENILDMHDLLQQMGQDIVRQQCPKEPGQRSRLWDSNDVDSVLTRNTATQEIEGLVVKISTSNQIQFSTDCFKKMNRLRLLKVYQPFWSKFNVNHGFKVDLPKDFEIPSFMLRYFHFEWYPLGSLPTNFHAKNLAVLCLEKSNIKQLWKGNEILDYLKVINLRYSRALIEFPDFASVPKLEILILEGCGSLESLPGNFHKMEHLQSLSCKFCSKMKSFPEIKGNMSKLRKIDFSRTSIKGLPSSIRHLKALEHFDLEDCVKLVSLPKSICNWSSLETFNVSGCSNLKGLPEINDGMKSLVKLDLSNTGIEELPCSIEHLKALKYLDLFACKNLVSLPQSIWKLSFLETLNVRGCFNLKGFPEIFKNDMGNLVELNLSNTGIEELPCSIGHLKALKHLDLSICTNLVSLPESIFSLSSLNTLNLQWCSNLKGFSKIKNDKENLIKLPDSIGHLKALKHLNLWGCKSLGSPPKSIWNLSFLETLNVRGCSSLKGGFLEINESMENLVKLNLSNTDIEELPYSIGHLKALKDLDLSMCANLVSLPESIWTLSFLETLDAQGCCNLKGFPEIKNGMENLVRLNLSQTGQEELPYSIRNLKALKYLDLSNCDNLVSLPDSICNLSSLETLKISDCPKHERLEVNWVGSSNSSCSIIKQGVIWSNESFSSLKSLNLQGDHIFPLSSLVELCIRNSKGTGRRIPSAKKSFLSPLKVSSVGNFNQMAAGILSDIFLQSSLKSLSLRDCNLIEAGISMNIQKLSSVLVNLSLTNCNLREGDVLNHICHLSLLKILSLDGNHFSSIPAGICLLSNLRDLSLRFCEKLRDIPALPSSLRNLDMSFCMKLQDILELPSSLEDLGLSHCKELQNIPELPSSLRDLRLSHCEELQKIPELPSSLRDLSLSHCRKLQKIPKLPSTLRGLNWSHCKKLQKIPELPSSLRILDAHCSNDISSSPLLMLIHSLFHRFKADLFQGTWISIAPSKFKGNGICIVIPRSSGILEGIRNLSMGSDDVRIELPQNWYQNNELLGFALYCVYVPVLLDDGFNEAGLDLHCKLTTWRNDQSEVMGALSFVSICDCYYDDVSLSDQVWVIYYPKDAIDNKYWSNEWKHWKASFHGKGVKVKECWFHLIYSEEHQQNQMPKLNLLENYISAAKGTKRRRDDKEHNEEEEPRRKRLRRTNTDFKL